MKSKIVGGQAVIEGVLMKHSDNVAIAVRKHNRKISVKKEKFKSFSKKSKIFLLPFVRGGINLLEMMVLGLKSLTYSANESLDEEQEKLSNKEITFTIIFSMLIAVGLFFLLPLFITNTITKSNGIIFHLIDGIIRIAILLTYIISISFMKDIKRMFEYHGAEHKTVNCYEAGEELTIKNVKKHSKLNPRCGTSFIFFVLMISILVFSLIPTPNFWLKLASRVLLLPVIAGISYELLKFSAAHSKNKILKILISPGLMMQNITTREPNDKQIEVAIAALKEVV